MASIVGQVGQKVRIVLVVDNEVRDTMRLAAAEEGTDNSELMSMVIRKAFPEALKRVRQRQQKTKD